MTYAHNGDSLHGRLLRADGVSLTSSHFAEVDGVTTTGHAFGLPLAEKGPALAEQKKGSTLFEVPGAVADSQQATVTAQMADSVTQVIGRIGHMEPFDDSSSDWTSYSKRLTSFLHFNKVPEADKVHAFLSLIGAKTYALLKSLTAPDLPSSKSYDTLRHFLGDHLAPKPSLIGALFEPAGVAEVVVEHIGQSVLLLLYVTEQGGPALLGREWLQHVRLDWNEVFSCNKLCSARKPTNKEAKAEASKLLQKYSNLFKEELGCITEKAELFLKKDARL
ncbi:hypothetical protein HPB51_013505 [Rhipicephalus microplus]|uniref:Uncharacterized protein n=1 Tax=Rhipicephalus microplus TaxID=6941 RepID=A0A9J6EGF3_RHIMP|nr:hypothetical protein HPB51_013505 [Rhipicephalus microplus]